MTPGLQASELDWWGKIGMVVEPRYGADGPRQDSGCRPREGETDLNLIP